MKPKAKMNLHAVEFDQAELMCILLEEMTGQTRPEGLSAAEALRVAQVVGRDQAEVDEFRAAIQRASERIIRYVVDLLVAKVPGAIKGASIDGRLQ